MQICKIAKYNSMPKIDDLQYSSDMLAACYQQSQSVYLKQSWPSWRAGQGGG